MTFVPFKVPLLRSTQAPADDQMRILCVEDEDLNWEIMQNELESQYSITRAKGAQEVFALLSQNTYHLILMDIQLSGSELSGLQICQILKGRCAKPVLEFAQGIQAPELPIVFVTAYAARYSREELIAAGGEDLVTKPFDFRHLSLILARIRERIREHGMQREPR